MRRLGSMWNLVRPWSDPKKSNGHDLFLLFSGFLRTLAIESNLSMYNYDWTVWKCKNPNFMEIEIFKKMKQTSNFF
jgi:hypothetical protein